MKLWTAGAASRLVYHSLGRVGVEGSAWKVGIASAQSIAMAALVLTLLSSGWKEKPPSDTCLPWCRFDDGVGNHPDACTHPVPTLAVQKLTVGAPA